MTPQTVSLVQLSPLKAGSPYLMDIVQNIFPPLTNSSSNVKLLSFLPRVLLFLPIGHHFILEAENFKFFLWFVYFYI